MNKRLLVTAGVCLALLLQTLSFSLSHAEENPYHFGPQGDISCPTPKMCTAIVSGFYAGTDGIVVYEGSGNTWKNGIVIDLMKDPDSRKILEDNDIKGVNPIALMCMSVGNCEALLVGAQEYTERYRPDNTGYTQFTTVAPYKMIYFSLSQVDSQWQKPKYIEQLDSTQNHIWHPFTSHASIYCSSHGNCAIAGNRGGPTEELILKSIGKHVAGESQLDAKPFFISQVNGVWGAPQFPMAKKIQNRGAQFYTLNCKSLSDCIIQGGYIPPADELLRLKKQNKIDLKYNSILYLGFTLSLENGKWREPKPNLGGNFKKGPYPKGDPKVFVRNDPTGNLWNSPTNMMACIKTYSCRIEPVSQLELRKNSPQMVPPIQPAGVGDPTWPVKCPAVIDTVKVPQPKILGFKFDGTGEVFTRLADSTSTVSKEPSDIVGCYVVLNWFLPNPKNANGFHIGTISRDDSGYYWENASGVRWGLSLSGSILMTDKDNPYYATGRQFITF